MQAWINELFPPSERWKRYQRSRVPMTLEEIYGPLSEYLFTQLLVDDTHRLMIDEEEGKLIYQWKTKVTEYSTDPTDTQSHYIPNLGHNSNPNHNPSPHPRLQWRTICTMEYFRFAEEWEICYRGFLPNTIVSRRRNTVFKAFPITGREAANVVMYCIRAWRPDCLQAISTRATLVFHEHEHDLIVPIATATATALEL